MRVPHLRHFSPLASTSGIAEPFSYRLITFRDYCEVDACTPTKRSDFQICGIAGYSIDPASGIDRTLAAQALLAGIAERGADAVGYAYRELGANVTVHKQRTGASELLDAVALPARTTQALVHVRDYTKGHPTISANNHPIRHGSVVGIHNGIIENDEEIFARYRFGRAEPEMTVDSEAIFALMEATEGDHRALEQLYGAMATGWLDEREGEVLMLARGVARPLWVGRGRRELFFASTRAALEVVERTLRVSLREDGARRRAGCCACATGASSTSNASGPTARTARRAFSPPCVRRTREHRAWPGSPSSPPRVSRSPGLGSSAIQTRRRESGRLQASPRSGACAGYDNVPSALTATPSSRRRSRTRY